MTNTILSKAVQDITFSGNQSSIIGNDYFSSQISLTTPEAQADMIKKAIKNGLSIVNITECVEKLKEYYSS